jgi:hypothetical protein
MAIVIVNRVRSPWCWLLELHVHTHHGIPRYCLVQLGAWNAACCGLQSPSACNPATASGSSQTRSCGVQVCVGGETQI